jgi:hypothetical protein
MAPSLWRAALCLLACAASLAAGPIIREGDAIYLSDFESKPMKLKVLQPAPATFDLAGKRYVGTLRAGMLVEVQAITDDSYLVRGLAQQGQVLGWTSPQYLQPVPPEILAALKKSEERRRIVEALIAKKQVAIGMTTAEVERSIGKPQKRSQRASKDQALEQTWDYVKYELTPQTTNVIAPNGTLTTATTYLKTPIGRLTISFKGDIVDSLDQTEGTIFTGGETTIVTPPVVVYW